MTAVAVPDAALHRALPSRAAARPVRFAVGLAALWLVLGAGVGLALRELTPGMSGRTASLWATVLIALLATALVLAWGDPIGLGLSAPGRWRSPGWLALPFGLCLVPLAGGVHPLALGTSLPLVVGYTLTGWAEEGVWRGVVLQALRAGGLSPLRSALVCSGCFGAVHLTNVVFRGSVGLVAAQAFGAACFGVGMCALRLRTRALWPLMVAHALVDLVPHYGGLPAIPVFVAQDVVLLTVGLVLLRRQAGLDRGELR